MRPPLFLRSLSGHPLETLRLKWELKELPLPCLLLKQLYLVLMNYLRNPVNLRLEGILFILLVKELLCDNVLFNCLFGYPCIISSLKVFHGCSKFALWGHTSWLRRISWWVRWFTWLGVRLCGLLVREDSCRFASFNSPKGSLHLWVLVPVNLRDKCAFLLAFCTELMRGNQLAFFWILIPLH